MNRVFCIVHSREYQSNRLVYSFKAWLLSVFANELFVRCCTRSTEASTVTQALFALEKQECYTVYAAKGKVMGQATWIKDS